MLKLFIIILITFNSFYNIELNAETIEKYNRKNWSHWVTVKDGVNISLNTRQKVLYDENVSDTLICLILKGDLKIIKGTWVCPYSGDTIYDPRKLDIDHLVPLKNAFESGGKRWSKRKKKEYANYLKDENHLVACKASLNRQKGSKGPLEWMPEKNKIWYVKSWVHIKRLWNLKCDIIIPNEK